MPQIILKNLRYLGTFSMLRFIDSIQYIESCTKVMTTLLDVYFIEDFALKVNYFDSLPIDIKKPPSGGFFKALNPPLYQRGFGEIFELVSTAINGFGHIFNNFLGITENHHGFVVIE